MPAFRQPVTPITSGKHLSDFPRGGGRGEIGTSNPQRNSGGGMGTRAKNNPPRRRGPKPERLPGPWEGAVGKSLGKKRPERGWPKPAKTRGRGS
jgi:hypothetical protein